MATIKDVEKVCDEYLKGQATASAIILVITKADDDTIEEIAQRITEKAS